MLTYCVSQILNFVFRIIKRTDWCFRWILTLPQPLWLILNKKIRYSRLQGPPFGFSALLKSAGRFFLVLENFFSHLVWYAKKFSGHYVSSTSASKFEFLELPLLLLMFHKMFDFWLILKSDFLSPIFWFLEKIKTACWLIPFIPKMLLVVYQNNLGKKLEIWVYCWNIFISTNYNFPRIG